MMTNLSWSDSINWADYDFTFASISSAFSLASCSMKAIMCLICRWKETLSIKKKKKKKERDRVFFLTTVQLIAKTLSIETFRSGVKVEYDPSETFWHPAVVGLWHWSEECFEMSSPAFILLWGYFQCYKTLNISPTEASWRWFTHSLPVPHQALTWDRWSCDLAWVVGGGGCSMPSTTQVEKWLLHDIFIYLFKENIIVTYRLACVGKTQ